MGITNPVHPYIWWLLKRTGIVVKKYAGIGIISSVSGIRSSRIELIFEINYI
jgi:hypothetical protein